jgi:hypothetical protein
MTAVTLEDARRVISAAEQKAQWLTEAETSSRTFVWTTPGLAASISL